jgi:hypothetical protein
MRSEAAMLVLWASALLGRAPCRSNRNGMAAQTSQRALVRGNQCTKEAHPPRQALTECAPFALCACHGSCVASARTLSVPGGPATPQEAPPATA